MLRQAMEAQARDFLAAVVTDAPCATDARAVLPVYEALHIAASQMKMTQRSDCA